MTKMRLTIELMKEIADEKGGQCLSEEYINQSTKLTWKCSAGHIWETTPMLIRRGTWCPTCARKSENRKKVAVKLTINDMQQVAEERGGKCLSDTYTGSSNKLIWECSEGHRWDARPGNVRNGSWCPTCAQGKKFNKKVSKLTIADMKKMATDRGGKCLSQTYKNSLEKLAWECAEGHIWEATPTQLRSKNSWCPICARKNFGQYRKYTIEMVKAMAEERGGECLSADCPSSTTKLQWKCMEGHIWETTPANVTSGTWCPHCAGNHQYSIEKMQKLAEERGGECLSTTYKNVVTKLLWKCANGHEFHSIPKHVLKGHWCPNCTLYLNEQRCRYILESLFDTIFVKDLTVLDGYELDGYNADLQLAFEYHGQQHYEQVDFFYSRGDMNLQQRIERDQLKEEMCVALGIELLVIPYTIKPEDQISFITNELTIRGFKFKLNPSDINFDNYYPTKKELEEIQEIAIEKGGKCLSNVYSGVDNKMDFVCKWNHHFSTTPWRIKKGNWCRECYYLEKAGASQRLDSDEMHQIAKDKGWECLSTEYKNARTKLLWECSNGHQFERTLGHVKEGRGCPTCSKMKLKKK